MLPGGCADSGEILRDEFPPTSAVVFGQVSGPDGSDVRDAVVTAAGWRLDCPSDGGSGPFEGPETTTGDDGNYRLRFDVRGVGAEDMCLVVRADPPAGTSLAPAADTGASVMLSEDAPLDSVRVDLVLPSGS